MKIKVIILLIALILFALVGNTSMQILLGIVLVLLLIGFGIGYLIVKVVSYGAEKKGKEYLLHLRRNPNDVRTILGEMRFIAEGSFNLYDEYNTNKANASKSISSGMSTFKKQDKLLLAMNHNVKAEWIPRYKFLDEIQSSFCNDNELYNAFLACKDIDKSVRKLSLWNINLTNYNEYNKKAAKVALAGAAIGAIASIAVVSVTQSMVNNAGKGMFNSPKSRDKWIDRESGEEFDYNPNL